MDDPGPMGAWSFRDLGVHLLGWRERTIRRLEAVAAGQPEPPDPWPAELGDDDDRINDWFQAQAEGRGADEVLADVDRSYERLAAVVEALGPERLTSRDAFPWLEGETLAETDLFGHLHDEHVPTIQAWLGEVLPERPAR